MFRQAIIASAVLVVGFAIPLLAQDLEPRAYSASPTGLNFLLLAGGSSSGGVLVDPSLPVTDVSATVASATVGAGTTFSLFGRTALLVAAFPYAWGSMSGRVGDSSGHVDRDGLADPRIKLSVNLLGGKAVGLREFAIVRPSTIIGVSLTVAAPLGQYDPAKLINLGANRWGFKPEVGVSRVIRRFTIDGYAGAWLFTANDAFYPGTSLREQRPIYALQAHVGYTIRPRLWLAIDSTWYTGGLTSIDGVGNADLQRNSRVGATFSLPLTRSQSIKAASSAGATTRIGGDFKTINVAWQLSWFRGGEP